MVFPDYDRSILSIVASVLNHYGLRAGYPTLPELDERLSTAPAHVVLMILDGLGKTVLERNLSEGAYLRRKAAATVTSVFPSTTAAAVTSYTNGLSPLEHGWLGWYLYMKEYASDVKTFLRSSYYTEQSLGGPHPAYHLMPYETILTRIRKGGSGARTYSIYPPYDSNTDRGAEIGLHAGDFEQLCGHLRRICRQRERSFTFAYWPEPDATMHDHGTDAPEAKQAYRDLSQALDSLSGKLDDTLLIVASDHGRMDAREWIDLSQDAALLETLVMPPMLESRASAFYVKAHRRADFEAIFREKYGEKFLLLSREEVYSSGIFGRGKPHKKFDDFIGDYVACATADSVFAYSLPGKAHYKMTGYHAGLTEAEMNVAVILDRTEKRT